jgi:cell division protein FtsZ
LAFSYADDVLRQAVQGISDLITKTGLVNTDFADVEATMKGQGDALMGIGMGMGDNRARDAAESSIDNPMLEDTSIEGATRVLINIAGPADISMVEIDEILETIKKRADPNVEIIHGINEEPDLGDSIKVTVIATGFQSKVAVSVPAEDPQRKVKAAPVGEIISSEVFDRMRGQGSNKRSLDGYVGIGIGKQRGDYGDLETPTAVRWYNPEAEAVKTVAGGRDA